MTDFSDVLRFLSQRDDLRCGTGAREEDIHAITSTWGKLPQDYEQFLRRFGWVEFGTYELAGTGSSVPTHLDVLLRARELWSAGINRDLLPIYEPGSDWMYCLNRNGKVVSLDIDGTIDAERELDWSDWFIQKFSRC